MAPAEMGGLTLSTSAPSFVFDSAERTVAVALTQMRCGGRWMILALHPTANNQSPSPAPHRCQILVSCSLAIRSILSAQGVWPERASDSLSLLPR